ncbi:MAG: LPXTG cell wall anchor domain-containing protein [Oscillospiraceae bacterium]|nr:LPXTG cell wall anchor domain-containing protein [Oscillospiraceae bacterium]
MKMKKFLAAIAALAMATVPTMAVNAKITNANKEGKDYFVPIAELLPEGCTIEDAKYAYFRFSCPNYGVPGQAEVGGCNGAIVFNTQNGGWNSVKWAHASDPEGICTYPDDGSDFSITREITQSDMEAFMDPGDWCEVAIQHWWPEDIDITIEEVYLMDANQVRLEAKAPAETTPSETEATPAQSETEATTEATAAATTAAATTKAAAAATTKANPTTGESNTGVALAVTAAMAAAGVAVTFGKKKK